MANRTVKEALSVKGTNPQYLVEKIIRTRIYDSKYWKEECFALTAGDVVEKAAALRYVGGVYGGNIKPTPFLSLTLKMLQIQPEKDIIIEFIKNEEFKYVRALGAFYMRLVGSPIECYRYLEPLYNDYRKIRFQNKDGKFELLYMDDFIDHLLRDERYCDVILPRLQKRQVLEEANELEPKVSALEEDLDDDSSESEEEGERRGGSVSPPPSTGISRNREKGRDRERSKDLERDRSRDRQHDRDRRRDRSHERERSRDRERRRQRSRSRSRDRRRNDDRDRRDRRERSSEKDRRDRRERSTDRDRRDRRERSPERDRRDRNTERDRRERHQEKDRKQDRKHESDKGKSKREDREKASKKKDGKKSTEASSAIDQEIAEANALRAKLGLAPLRP